MHDIWKDMFVMGLPLAEKILRPIFVYAFLVVSLRLSGKRELVQLNPFDLVVLLTLSNTVQNAIIGEDNSVLGGIIGATSLLATNYLVVRFLYDHRKLDQIVEGRSDVLVDCGKVHAKNLKKELITISQLEAAARKQGFASLSEVEQCVLEPGGLSITHKFSSHDEAQLDIGQPRHASPKYGIARRRIARARKIAPKSREPDQITRNQFYLWTPRSSILRQLIEQMDFQRGEGQCRRSVRCCTVHHRQPENPPAKDAKDRDQIG